MTSIEIPRAELTASLPDLVPARMLNEFTYCPRLAYLEWVQGEWGESADTLDGTFQHRRVDRPGGPMPSPDADERGSQDAGESAAAETIHSRSVHLSATGVGLVAIMDLVEAAEAAAGGGEVGKGGRKAKAAGRPAGPVEVTPVDYKRGRVPDIPGRAWEPERVQLCAQGLILRENGYRCDGGVLYFVESRTRVPVPFDDALVARTLELLGQMRAMAAGGRMPPPLVDSPKCPRCSLVGICLPDETRLLADGAPVQVTVSGQEAKRGGVGEKGSGGEEDGEDEQPRVRMLIPRGGDGRPLYVTEARAWVGKSNDVVRVSAPAEYAGAAAAGGSKAGRGLRGGKRPSYGVGSRGGNGNGSGNGDGRAVLAEVRMSELLHVCLFGSPQISTQLVHELCDRQVPVAYFSFGGYFRGLTTGLPSKNVELRIEQYRKADDPAFCLSLARAWVTGKIENQRTLLRRNHPNGRALTLAMDDLKRAAARAGTAQSLETLLGIEGNAAKAYFGCFQGMLRPRGDEPRPDARVDAADDAADDAASSDDGVTPTDFAAPPPPTAPKAKVDASPSSGATFAAVMRAARAAKAKHALPAPKAAGESAGATAAEAPAAAPKAAAVARPPLAGERPPAGFRFHFDGRNRRPPTDPVNALLSLGYAVLAKDLTAACWVVGLDPFLGFFHQVKYGRPALALDLMEEGRAIVVDSTVLTVINTGVVTASDFVRRGPAVALKPEGRRRFLQAYERRMETLVTHPLFGYRISYRRLLEVQARLLSRVLLGELPAYVPFTTR